MAIAGHSNGYTTAALALTLAIVSVSATVSRNLFLYLVVTCFCPTPVSQVLKFRETLFIELVLAKCIDGGDEEKIWSVGLRNLRSLWDLPGRKVLLREEVELRLSRSSSITSNILRKR